MLKLEFFSLINKIRRISECSLKNRVKTKNGTRIVYTKQIQSIYCGCKGRRLRRFETINYQVRHLIDYPFPFHKINCTPSRTRTSSLWPQFLLNCTYQCETLFLHFLSSNYYRFSFNRCTCALRFLNVGYFQENQNSVLSKHWLGNQYFCKIQFSANAKKLTKLCDVEILLT